MQLRKLEEFEMRDSYPQRVQDTFKILSEKLDNVTLEIVRELAEMCYKDGMRDGIRFADWLNERTH